MKRERETEVTVPGTPDEVWDAIATSEGIGSWMFAADVRSDAVVLHQAPFAPDVTVEVTARERPHRFAYRRDQPPLATEFLVEARSEGTCVVRVVTSFGDVGEEWEDLLDGAIEGWSMTLRVLRAYLMYFRGQPSAVLSATADTGLPVESRLDVFERMLASLELDGVVEHTSPGFVLVRTSSALYAFSAFPMDKPSVSVNVHAHIYGPDAAVVAARDEPRWADWAATLMTTGG
jgi:uncharacterized protein YndB with AHSA1/START domain